MPGIPIMGGAMPIIMGGPRAPWPETPMGGLGAPIGIDGTGIIGAAMAVEGGCACADLSWCTVTRAGRPSMVVPLSAWMAACAAAGVAKSTMAMPRDLPQDLSSMKRTPRTGDCAATEASRSSSTSVVHHCRLLMKMEAPGGGGWREAWTAGRMSGFFS